MPQSVTFPELGIVDFPDEMSAQEIAAQAPAIRMQLIRRREQLVNQQGFAEAEQAMSPLERVASMTANIPASVAKSGFEAYADVVGSLGNILGAIPSPPPQPGGFAYDTEHRQPIGERLKAQAKGVREFAEEAFPVNPATAGFFTTTLPGALGYTGSTIIQSAGSGGVAPVLGGLQAFQGMYERELEKQKELGQPEDKTSAMLNAGLYGTIAGFIQSKLGIGRILRPSDSGTLLQSLVKNPIAGGIGGALQQAASDLISEGKPNLEAIRDQGVIGALVMGILGGSADVLRNHFADTAQANWQKGRPRTAGVDVDERVQAEIQKVRKSGASPEFRSFFGGIDPYLEGTTPEKVAAFARSMGMEYKYAPPSPEQPSPTIKRRPIRGLIGQEEVQRADQIQKGVEVPSGEQAAPAPQVPEGIPGVVQPAPGGSTELGPPSQQEQAAIDALTAATAPEPAPQPTPTPAPVAPTTEPTPAPAPVAPPETKPLSKKEQAERTQLLSDLKDYGLAIGDTYTGLDKPVVLSNDLTTDQLRAINKDILDRWTAEEEARKAAEEAEKARVAALAPAAPPAPTPAPQRPPVPSLTPTTGIDGHKLIDELGVDLGLNLTEEERRTARVTTPLPFANASSLVAIERAKAGVTDPAALAAVPTLTELGNAMVVSGRQFKKGEADTRSHWFVLNEITGDYEPLAVWRNSGGKAKKPAVVVRASEEQPTGISIEKFFKDHPEYAIDKPSYRVILNRGVRMLSRSYSPAEMAAMYDAAQPTAPPPEGRVIVPPEALLDETGETEAPEEAPGNEPPKPKKPVGSTKDAVESTSEKEAFRRQQDQNAVQLPNLGNAAESLYSASSPLQAGVPITISNARDLLEGMSEYGSPERKLAFKAIVAAVDFQLTRSGYYKANPTLNRLGAQIDAAANAVAKASTMKAKEGFIGRFVQEIARLGTMKIKQPAPVFPPSLVSKPVVPKGLQEAAAVVSKAITDSVANDTITALEGMVLKDKIKSALEHGSTEELGSIIDHMRVVLGHAAGQLKIPRLEWVERKDGKFEAPATKEFLTWWDANGKSSNPLGLTTEQRDGKWYVVTDKIPGLDVRYSLAGGPVIGPMSVPSVESVIRKYLGLKKLPKNMRVVETGEIPEGQRKWKGRVVIYEDGPFVTLNASYLGSPSDVIQELTHEALHLVFRDPSPEMRQLWKAILEALPPEQVAAMREHYPSHQAQEEAANEFVRNINANEKARGFWRRLLDAIWAYIKKLFGIRSESYESLTRELMVSRAILMAKGVMEPPSAKPGTIELLSTETIPYGYWISPSGDMTPVTTAYDHIKVAKEIVDKLMPGNDLSPGAAQTLLLSRGYARAIYERPQRTMFLDTLGHNISPRQASAARNFAIERNINAHFNGYTVESRGRPVWREALHIIEPDPLYSTEVIPYGFWLSPEGKMVPVAYEDHVGEAHRILSKLEPQTDLTEGSIYEKMFERGWARLVYSRHSRTLTAERWGGGLTNAQMRELKNYAIERNISAHLEGEFPRPRRSIYNAGPEELYSLVKPNRTIFNNITQLEEAKSTLGLDPEQVRTIEAVGKAQGSLVDTDTAVQVGSMITSPVRSERIAGRTLTPLTKYYELGGNKLWMAALFPELLAPGKSVLDLDLDDQSIAALAAYSTDKYLKNLLGRIEKYEAKAANQAAIAAARLPLAKSKEIEAGFAGALVDRLLEGMKEQIANQRKLGGINLGEKQRAALQKMNQEIRDIETGLKPALSVAFMNMAQRLPPGVMKGTDAILPNGTVVPAGTPLSDTGGRGMVHWIRAQSNIGDPIAAKGIVDWMITPDATGFSPIENYPDIGKRLLQLYDVLVDRTSAVLALRSFKNWLFANSPNTKATQVTLRQFARKYVQWVNQNQYAREVARQIHADYARREDERVGFGMAKGILNKLFNSSEYQRQVQEAADKISAHEANLSALVGDSKVYEAKGPFADTAKWPVEARTISMPATQESALHNADVVPRLFDAINQWLASPAAANDPASARAWKQESDWLRMHGMLTAAQQGLYAQIGARPYGIPSQLMLTLGITGAKQSLAEMLPPMVKNQYANDAGNLAIVLSKLGEIFQHPKHGRLQMIEAIDKAARSHEITGREVMTEYVPEIMNKIYARNQSVQQVRLKEGDRLPGGEGGGEIINKEDMEAVAMMKAHTDEIYAFLQKNKQFKTIIESFLRIYDPELNIYRTNVGAGYMLEHPRSLSRKGYQFAEKWNAVKKTEITPAGSTVPRADKRIALINENPLVLNDYWTSNNPEFTKGSFYKNDDVTRTIHEKRVAEQKADPAVDLNFGGKDPVEEYVLWAGPERAAITGNDVAVESAKARELLIAAFDAYADAVHEEHQPKKIENEAGPIATFTNTPKGPLTYPRGQMVAPDFFYNYTLASITDYSNFRGKAALPFMVRAHTGLEAVVRALQKSVEDKKAYLATIRRPGEPEVFARRRLRSEEKKAARAGKTVFSLRELELALKMATAEFDRLTVHISNAQKSLYDPVWIELARRGEESMTLPLLAAETQTANNALTALLGSSIIEMMIGQSSGAAQYPLEWGKLHLRVGKMLARAVANVPALKKHIEGNQQLYSDLTKLLIQWAKEEYELAELMNKAGIGTRLGVADRIKAAKARPDTYGELESRDLTELQRAAFRILSFFSGSQIGGVTIPGLEGLKQWAQFTDLNTLPQVSGKIELQLDKIKRSLLIAMQKRASGETVVANWNDPSKPLTPFTPKEVGAPDYRSLQNLRQFFSPVGILEQVALDYWNEVKNMPDERDQIAHPLLPEPSMNNVVLEMFRASGNPVDEMNRATRLRSTGSVAFIQQALMRFQSWAANFSGRINRIFTRDIRDMPKDDLKLFLRGFLLLLSIIGVAIFAKEEVARVRGVVSGDEPSTPRLASVETPGDVAKLAASSIASVVLPYYGEQLSRLMGTTANRPVLDTAALIPSLGIAASLADAVTRTVQSHDPVLPMLDFVRRSMPYARPVIHAGEITGFNPAQGALPIVGQALTGDRGRLILGDTAARQAARAVRSAAPAGMEKAGGGGTGGRLTPMSGIIRRAVDLAYAGDEEGAKAQIERAVQYQVGQGKSEDEARRSVRQSVEARNPARMVLGKTPTSEDEKRIMGRMTASQAAAYSRAKNAFGILGSVTGGKPIKLVAVRDANTKTRNRRPLFSSSRSLFGRSGRSYRRRNLGRSIFSSKRRRVSKSQLGPSI